MADKEATLLLKVKQAGSEAIGGVTKMLLNLSNAINVGKAAWGMLKSAGEAVLGAWGEQEDAINSLNQTMVQNGMYSKNLSKNYLDMATALQRTSTFGDEQIIQAQSLMQANLGQTEISKELMKATLDLAAAKKMDLSAAAEMVGKSIGTETNALARNGIELDAGASKSEKLAAVTQQLNNKFGGQAEAATKGMGSFTQMNNAISDLFEIIGGKLFPIIAPITKSITDMAYALNDSSDTTTAVGKAFAVLNDSISVTKGVFETFFNVIKLGFTELYSVVKEPLESVGNAVKDVADGVADAFKTAFSYWTTDSMVATNEVSKILKEGSDKINADLKANEEKRVNESEVLRQKDEENIKASNVRKQEIEAQNNIVRLESFNSAKQTELENELALEQMRQDAKKNQSQIYTQQEIELAKSKEEKLRMMQTNQTAFESAQSKVRLDAAIREGNFKKIMASEQVATLQSTFSQISTMQDSHNKSMATIGKAAAIANIMINTAQGAMAAYSLGPILGSILAPLVIAAGAMQIAKVSGVQLAEGGIVKAREGGIQATIGEGGRDEAVIPLDRAGGMGTTVNIYSYGGLLGNTQEAREFALAVDKELLKLRQGNESQAFDSSIT